MLPEDHGPAGRSGHLPGKIKSPASRIYPLSQKKCWPGREYPASQLKERGYELIKEGGIAALIVHIDIIMFM
jgi:hypothetical protein